MGRPPQSVSMTRQNASGAASPVCRHVVAAVVGGGVGAVIGVSCSRRIRPVPIAMAGVTIASVAVGAVRRGAALDAAKIGLTATIETTQSGSTIEPRRTTGDVARSCAPGATGGRPATGPNTLYRIFHFACIYVHAMSTRNRMRLELIAPS
jgi:hypothetical protein